jgi:hypothetical protein
VHAGLELPPGTDDEHSSRRRARDRCIAGVVRESMRLEVGVEVQQRCFQWQASAAAVDAVLAHLRADDRGQAAPHTHRAPRAEHGSNSQGLPRRADAISKSGVRRLDTGRVVRHESDGGCPALESRLASPVASRLEPALTPGQRHAKPGSSI